MTTTSNYSQDLLIALTKESSERALSNNDDVTISFTPSTGALNEVESHLYSYIWQEGWSPTAFTAYQNQQLDFIQSLQAISGVSGFSYQIIDSIGAEIFCFSYFANDDQQKGFLESQDGEILYFDAAGLAKTFRTDESEYAVATLNTYARSERDADIAGDGSYILSSTVHELLHCLGLADIESETNSILYDVRYTAMAYSARTAFGHPVTPMAFDVAVLEATYGLSEKNSGDTSYNLTEAGTTALDVNGSDGTVAIGRAYYCIVDSGDDKTNVDDFGDGDEIRFVGNSNSDVLINLNDATLSDKASIDMLALVDEISITSRFLQLSSEIRAEYVGNNAAILQAGGFISRILSSTGDSQQGGFTIAHGAEIENAVGGSGNDVLIGNRLNNKIIGDAGSDLVHGFSGDDSIRGGQSLDTIYGGDGSDFINGDTNADSLIGGVGKDRILGAEGTDTIFSNFQLNFGDFYYDDSEDLDIDDIDGGSGNDTIFAGNGDHVHGATGNDSIYGGSIITGGDNDDYIDASRTTGYFDVDGGNHNDTIIGGDFGVIHGGSGIDHITTNGAGSVYGGTGTDTIVLSGILAEDETGGIPVLDVYGESAADTVLVGEGIKMVSIYTGSGSDTIHVQSKDTYVDVFDEQGVRDIVQFDFSSAYLGEFEAFAISGGAVVVWSEIGYFNGIEEFQFLDRIVSAQQLVSESLI